MDAIMDGKRFGLSPRVGAGSREGVWNLTNGSRRVGTACPRGSCAASMGNLHERGPLPIISTLGLRGALLHLGYRLFVGLSLEEKVPPITARFPGIIMVR
jgi:hypothetical protein